MGVFYDKQNKQKQVRSYYNILFKATDDEYLVASNYRNIGDMYFKNAKYPVAAQYYSTLVK
jgi:hypothetical protein